MLKVKYINYTFWFGIISLLALSFPFQVTLMSQWPAISPYFLLGTVLLFHSNRITVNNGRWRQLKSMEFFIGLYIAFVLIHSIWQTAIGAISVGNGAAAIFMYAIPVVFYWYSSRIATLGEIRIILAAVIIAGLISGLFFAYDSILKIGFKQISQFSKDAVLYSHMRGQGGLASSELSSMRATLHYRSFGLLETHTVSAAWTAFGCFAALSFLPAHARLIRLMTIFLFSFCLLAGLNFSSIIGFSLVILFYEYKPYRLLQGKIYIQLFKDFHVLFFMATLIMIGVVMMTPTELRTFFYKNLTGQVALLTVGRAGNTYYGLFLNKLTDYLLAIKNFPPMLLVGDGYSSFGMLKGGDIGVIDTMARFGVPFFFITVIGLARVILETAFGHNERCFPIEHRLLVFSASVILLLMILDLHYSVWFRKSVLPIFFFALGLYSRFGWLARNKIQSLGQ